MRCPKCGYISFDMVEKCAKCGRNVSAAAMEVKGTVASVPPPAFLSLDYTAREAEPEDVRAETEPEALDIGAEEEVFVDFADEEPAVEAEAASMEAEAGEPELEEAAIDISDLAPVEEEEMQIQEVGPEEVAVAVGDEKPTVSESTGQGLEDLKVEGIDLFASPPPPSGPDKVVQSVKTGTALDDFDVDLEELFKKK